MVYSVGETFEIIDFLKGWSPDQERSQSRHGRREKVLSLDCTGRYARSRIIEDRPHDIALDASIRAAAPYQIHRDRRGLAIALEPQDLREKVRERGRGTTILFLVDASGSIGARRRMVMVKGAILSMLNEAYLKRDRIGLMAFRREAVELLLPPTRSVSLAYKKLGELPTGGRTPLSLALTRAHNLMLAQARLFQGESCHVILVTDGRANVPLKDEEAMSEVLALAKNVRSPSYKWTVVDTGSSHLGMDNALRLAEALDAAYFRLDDLSAERLAERVRVVSA
jgi:magnesium chelatase subunit D